MKARDVLFWPGMAAEITEKVKKSPVYPENRPCQQPETLKSHEIPPLPWAKVGTDLLYKKGRNYLVTIDYCSKWPELTLVKRITCTAVITAFKSQFTRYGVPSVLCPTMVHVTVLSSSRKIGVFVSHRAPDTHSLMANQKDLSNP